MELFKVFGRIALKGADTAEEQLKRVNDKGSGTSNVFKAIGSAVKVASVAVTAFVASAGVATAKVVGLTDSVDKMSAKLGLSRKAYQEWKYILGQSGANIDGLKQSTKALANAVDEANKGNVKYSSSFKKLGVEIKDSNGSLKTQEQLFNETFSALASYGNETERAAMLSDLLGGSALELLPAMNLGAEGIENLRQRAYELGLVISDDVVDAGVAFGDIVDDVKQSALAMMTNAIAPFMPMLTELADNVIKVAIPALGQFVNKSFQYAQIAGVIFTGMWKIIKIIGDDIKTALQGPYNKIKEFIGELSNIPSIKNTIDFVMNITGNLYEAIKKGVSGGGWGDFFSTLFGVAKLSIGIGTTLYLIGGTAAAIADAIKVAMLAIPAFSAPVGTGSAVLALVSIGIAFNEYVESGNLDALVQNVGVALIGAFAAGVLTGNPATGVMTFNILLSFGIGKKISTPFDNFFNRMTEEINESASKFDFSDKGPFSSYFQGVQKAFSESGGNASKAFNSAMWEGVKVFDITGATIDLVKIIKARFEEALVTVKPFGGMFDRLVQETTENANSFDFSKAGPLGGIFTGFQNAFNESGGNAGKAFVGSFKSFLGTFDLVGAVIDLFRGTAGAKQNGEEVAEDVVDGFSGKIESQSTWSKIKDGFTGWVEALRAAWDSHSPSEESEDVGGDVAEGFENGVEEGTDSILGVFIWMRDTIKGILEGKPLLSGALGKDVDKSEAKVKGFFGKMKDWIAELREKLGDGFFGKMVDWLGESLKNTLASTWEFAKQLGSQVISNSPVLSSAVSGFKAAGVSTDDETGETTVDITKGLVGTFTSLIASSEWFGSMMEELNPILQEASNLIGTIVVPFIPIMKSLFKMFLNIVVAFKPFIDAFIWQLENVTLPVIKFISNAIIWIYNALAAAVNWILEVIDGIPFVNISWRMATAAYVSDADIAATSSTSSPSSTGGTQVSEITGPTRDLLTSLLSPLSSLDSLTGIGERIYDLLEDRLGNAVTIGTIQVTTGAGITTLDAATIAEIEEAIADRILFAQGGVA